MLHTRLVVLYTPTWEITDPASALRAVLEAPPVKYSYLLLETTWTPQDSVWRRDLSSAIRGLRDRFDHFEVVVLAPSPAEIDAWEETGEPALYCSHNAFVRADYFFPIPGRRPTFDAIYDAMWADVKRHQLAGDIESLALIAYPKPEVCTISYSVQAHRAVAQAVRI